MPAEPVDPSKPTFYLDTSTLSYAYQGAQVVAPPAVALFATLLPWIEMVARDANLVFSHFHLSEIAEWQDEQAARGLVMWLDSLPLVWARFWNHVQSDEYEHWLQVTVHQPAPEPVRPFARSMLDAFERMSAPSLRAVLDTPTLVSAWEKERRDHAIGRSARDFALQAAARFNEDRRSVGWPNVSPKKRRDLEELLAYRRRTELRERVVEADRSLKVRGVAGYAELAPDHNAFVDQFVDLYRDRADAMPLARVLNRGIDGFAETAARRAVNSNRFRRLDSSMTDLFHALIGAAYCDVFTCDQLTSSWLGDVRREIGRAPQIVRGADASAFVTELTATWP